MTLPETIEQAPDPGTVQTALAPKIPGLSKGNTAQVNRTVQIPLTGAPWALLQIPYPMTQENWKEMQSFLALMERPLTQPKQS